MTEQAEREERPVWARPEAFPAADPGWGWVDRKKRRHPCRDFEELSAAIVDDAGARVDLVWTPGIEHQVLPEEIPALHGALRDARVRWAQWDIDEGRRQMFVFGLFLGGFVLYSMAKGKPVLAFGPAGLALLLFIVLGLYPWYQGRKRLRWAHSWNSEDAFRGLPELRFETWLMYQRAPLTRILLGLLAAIGLLQLLGPLKLPEQVQAAALVKLNGRPQDWWRLATAPFLHGHPIHFLFNALGLAYLGRRVELLVRWPHLALALVLSSWVGGEVSSMFVSGPSIGASGGLMGLLGFLLVFESTHRPLVPDSARQRLLGGLVATGVIGVLGFKYIDNAAHGGGLIAGMLYAFALFPKSASPHRPRETNADRIAGLAALAGMVAAAAWTGWRLFG